MSFSELQGNESLQNFLLGFVEGDFLLSTIVNHHCSPPFGEYIYCIFFPTTRSKSVFFLCGFCRVYFEVQKLKMIFDLLHACQKSLLFFMLNPDKWILFWGSAGLLLWMLCFIFSTSK